MQPAVATKAAERRETEKRDGTQGSGNENGRSPGCGRKRLGYGKEHPGCGKQLPATRGHAAAAEGSTPTTKGNAPAAEGSVSATERNTPAAESNSRLQGGTLRLQKGAPRLQRERPGCRRERCRCGRKRLGCGKRALRLRKRPEARIRDGQNERLRRSKNERFVRFLRRHHVLTLATVEEGVPLLLECVLLLRQGAKPARIHIGPRNAPCAGNGAQSACRGIGGPRNENRGPGAGNAVVRHGSAGRRNGQTAYLKRFPYAAAGRADALAIRPDYMKTDRQYARFWKETDMERQTGVIIVAGRRRKPHGRGASQAVHATGGHPHYWRARSTTSPRRFPERKSSSYCPPNTQASGTICRRVSKWRRTRSPKGAGAVPLGEKRIGGPETRSGADRRTGRRAAAGVAGADPAHGRGRCGTRHGDSGRRACGFVPRNGRAASQIIDRRRLRIVQTPQVFRAELLRRALRNGIPARIHRRASVVELSGEAVFLLRRRTGEPEDHDSRRYGHRRSIAG